MNVLQLLGRFLGEKMSLIYGKLKQHVNDKSIHRTSAEVRGEITAGDIPAEIARVDAVNASLDGKVDKVTGRELMPSPGSVPSAHRFLTETGVYTEVADGCVVIGAVMTTDAKFTVDEGQLNEYYTRCVLQANEGTEVFFRFTKDESDIYYKVVVRERERDEHRLKAMMVSQITEEKGCVTVYSCNYTIDREASKAVFTGGTVVSHTFYCDSYTDNLLNSKADASVLLAHTGDLGNPHRVSKSQVGLSEVDNTGDADKPVSTATQAALTAHNESGEAHTDLRNGLENLVNGSVVAKTAEYAERLGNDTDSYTKAGLDAVLNKLVEGLSLNGENFVLTVAYRDGTVKEIDFPIESTVKDGRFDIVTNELVLVLVSGQEVRIPASGLTKVYTGKESVTATVDVNPAGEIRAEVKQGSVKKVHLNEDVLDEIASHQSKTGDVKDNVVTFPDQAVRENVASGDKLSVLFGKLKKWLGDLGALAFKSNVAKGDLDSALQAELNGKAGAGHIHTIADVTNIDSSWHTSLNSVVYKKQLQLNEATWFNFYADSNAPVGPFYAPTTKGETGQFLRSTTGEPIWEAINATTLGALSVNGGRVGGVLEIATAGKVTSLSNGDSAYFTVNTDAIKGTLFNKDVYVVGNLYGGTEAAPKRVAYVSEIPASLPASDVSSWAKAASKPGYLWAEIGNKPTAFVPTAHTHTKSNITDFPTSLPASDVYAWAKAASKPSYSVGEISNAAARSDLPSVFVQAAAPTSGMKEGDIWVKP